MILEQREFHANVEEDSDIALDRLKKMFDGSYEQSDVIIRFKGDMSRPEYCNAGSYTF